MSMLLDPAPAKGLRKGPQQPTFFPPCPKLPIVYGDLRGLALKVHRLREGRPIQLTAGVASFRLSDTFPIFKLWVFGPDGDRFYLGALAVQDVSRERLQAAIAAANPRARRAA